jgi:hypothetical protein
VLVRGVVGGYHIRTKLLKASLALGAAAVRIDHAADRSEVAGLELADCRPDPGHTTKDLMSGDAWIDSATPLVTYCMEV